MLKQRARPTGSSECETNDVVHVKKTRPKEKAPWRGAMVALWLLVVCWVTWNGSQVSLPTAFFTNHDHDGPPSSLVVRGKRKSYTPVPEKLRRLFMAEGKGQTTVSRAFYFKDWTVAKAVEMAHIYYRSKAPPGDPYPASLRPWQRYSRIPGSTTWESKDGFLQGFRRYAEREKIANLWFLPETYRLKEPADKKAFQKRLETGGKYTPWVLKKVNENNGVGIEMLAPNSPQLATAIQRVEQDAETVYIVSFDGLYYNLE
jgi:hypothetical protein